MTPAPRGPREPQSNPAPHNPADQPERPRNPLTDTLMGVADPNTLTMRVIRDGDSAPSLEPSHAPAIDPGEAFHADRGPLDEADEAHDLLILSDEVVVSEVEALAVSLWDDAGWRAPGVLTMHGDVTLRGPYTLPREVRARLRLPSWAMRAMVLDAPGETLGPIPPELVTAHPLVRAYAADQPGFAAWEVIEGLYGMARRLAGALRVGATGELLEPDPDSAVALTVYAPAWIAEDDLAALIAEVAPGDVVATPPTPPRRSGATRKGRRQLERAAAQFTEETLGAAEVARIAAEARAFDEMSAAHPMPPAGYSIVLTAGRTSHISVDAQPVDQVPPALRWEQWATGALGAYRLSWLPQILPGRGHALTRTQRVERLRVAETIEALATGLHHIIGGAILDEDGFLVAVGDPTVGE
ncbi:MAG: hypothetical protein E7A62_07765 [Actinomycetaceae bacterium]|nr:hypothetical protein [Actinomycetaceae bacterium]MDU0970873.1 hypothetical protein [Actinomycetaceae bacterium]